MLRYSSSALARAAAGHRVASIARLLNPGFYSFSSTVDGAASDSATDGGDRTASLHERGVLDSNDLLQFTTLYELQKHSTEVFGPNRLFGTYVAKDGVEERGEFEWMTYNDWGKKVETCRTVLKDIGIEEHSKIGIISNNRWEWATLAAAAYSLNATLVPMYEAQLPKDWTYILNDSGSVALFCATQDIYNRAIAEVLPSTPGVKATLCLDAPLGEPHAFVTAMDLAAGSVAEPVVPPTSDDLANLVYTSGTTGQPKGVELLHSNSCSNILGVRNMVENPHDFIQQTDVSLAFLPWAHSYGQTCELWCTVAHGSSMGVGRGVPQILEDLSLVKPTTLLAVPALYKRIYQGVHNVMEEAGPVRNALMKKALALGRRRAEAKDGSSAELGLMENFQARILDSIVLRKIRERFGGRLRHGFVAGAACPKEIIDFMDDIGIPICEGYGLTETSPIITLNTPYNRRPGSVGRTLKGVEVVILGENGLPAAPGDEGEICCSGPNVMRGYHNKPDATDEVITLAPDGISRLFHTGDLGRMNHDGWVTITGRLKEQYKLENGKYVCPGLIEEAIGMSRFVDQVVLAGDNRPHNVALIVPNWVSIRAELGITDEVSEKLLAYSEGVRSLIQAEINSMCTGLKKFEIPKNFTIVAPFTAANNMLTPKMSIRKHMVIRTYEDDIALMYGYESVEDELEPADGAKHENSQRFA